MNLIDLVLFLLAILLLGAMASTTEFFLQEKYVSGLVAILIMVATGYGIHKLSFTGQD